MNPGLRRLLTWIVPRSLRNVLRVNYVLLFQLGMLRAFRTRRIEWEGKPGNWVPWFTYSSLEYLMQFDLRDKTVFEFGAGHSTLFWGNQCKFARSVEADAQWHAWVQAKCPPNVDCIHRAGPQDYAKAILIEDRQFDIIVIDGHWRMECAQAAVGRLAPGGMIVLDNSNWIPEVAEFLRGLDLIQVDFSDFCPDSPHRTTTSLFLSRDFRFPTRSLAQPAPPVGGLPIEEWKKLLPHDPVMLRAAGKSPG